MQLDVKMISRLVLLLWGVTADVVLRGDLPLAVNDIGLGYSLIYGNPQGLHFKTGGEDPGLLLTRHVLDIEFSSEVPEELVYEHHDTCLTSRREELVYNAKSYQDELLQMITFNGDQVTEVTDLAFALSAGYRDIKVETESQDYVIQDVSTTCIYGTARYKLSLAGTNQYRLSDEFAKGVCGLPESYDENSYSEFIQRYGTHFVSGMKLGKWETDRTVVKLRDYVDMILKIAPDDTIVLGPPMSLQSVYEIDVESLKRRPDFPLSIAGTVYNLNNGATAGDDSLEPVTLELTSIDVALTTDFWQTAYSDELCRNVEDPASFLVPRRDNLLRALSSFGSTLGAETPADKPLMMPVNWPQGTYALPKPTDGCADQDQSSRWLEGWLRQNTETQDPDSTWTTAHLSGNLTSFIFELEFCVKPNSDDFSLDWPVGDYCIFKYHTCPTGFSEGFVLWDDEDTKNANAHGGVLPDGTYGPDTMIKYCCRDDGETYNPIVLPTDKPFYLFQYKQGCQEVAGMTFIQEQIQWDDDDKRAPSTADIGDVHPGMIFSNPPDHPYKNSGGTYSIIYYCYYEQRSEDIESSLVG